jgi:hypothetical protein
MDSVIIRKPNWIMFADSVGDRQEIHRDMSNVSPEIVEGYGLTKEFAPGMYIASFIQGWPCIQCVKSMKFRPKRVYDGDVIRVVALPNVVGKSIDYRFERGEETVCDVVGVRMGGPDGKEIKQMKEVYHEYNAEIRPSDVNYFLRSLGYCIEDGRPNMFLASHSGPALLDYAEKEGVKGGFHATQGFNSHFPYRNGLISVLIGDGNSRKGKKGELQTYHMQWVQNDRVIASGRASVGVLEEILKKGD